jgi:two-component system, OmpR family, response regulator
LRRSIPFNLRATLAQVVGETSTFGPDLVGTAARRHIRRQGRPQGVRAYRFDGWELNLNTRRLTAPDGRPVELSRGEFNLLVVLLGAPPRILGRDQLFDLSRLHNDEVYNRSIDVQILRLRRKIERDPAAPRYVRTERGVGYVFSAPVETLY